MRKKVIASLLAAAMAAGAPSAVFAAENAVTEMADASEVDGTTITFWHSMGGVNGEALDTLVKQFTITFWHSMGGVNGEALDTLVKQFNEENEYGITVDAQYQGEYDDSLNKLKSAQIGNMGADLVQVYEIGTRFMIDSGWIVPIQDMIDGDSYDVSQIEPNLQIGNMGADLVQVYEIGTRFMIDSGWIVPIQDMIDGDSYDVSQIEPNLAAYYTIDNELYSMPFNSSTPILYYNKDMFEKAGISEVPDSLELYSMPFNSSTPILYYNKDMFEKAGISEIPDSLEGIGEIGQQLLDKGGAGEAMSMGIYGWFFEQLISKQGLEYANNGNGREEAATAGQQLLDKGGAGEAMSMGIYGWFFEQLISKQGLEYANNGNGREEAATAVAFDENGAAKNILTAWKELNDKGFAPIVGKGGDAGLADFSAGKSAITLGSTASLKQILQDVDGKFEVGTAYFPKVTSSDEGGVSIGGASLWALDNQDPKKLRATWEFIKFMNSPESQAYWNAQTGYFPVTVAAQDEDTFKQNVEAYPQFQTAIDQLHDSAPEYAGALYPQFQTAIDQLHDSAPEYAGALLSVFPEARAIVESEIENLLNGNEDVDATVKNMAESINESIEEYNLVNE